MYSVIPFKLKHTHCLLKTILLTYYTILCMHYITRYRQISGRSHYKLMTKVTSIKRPRSERGDRRGLGLYCNPASKQQEQSIHTLLVQLKNDFLEGKKYIWNIYIHTMNINLRLYFKCSLEAGRPDFKPCLCCQLTMGHEILHHSELVFSNVIWRYSFTVNRVVTKSKW